MIIIFLSLGSSHNICWLLIFKTLFYIFSIKIQSHPFTKALFSFFVILESSSQGFSIYKNIFLTHGAPNISMLSQANCLVSVITASPVALLHSILCLPSMGQTMC